MTSAFLCFLLLTVSSATASNVVDARELTERSVDIYSLARRVTRLEERNKELENTLVGLTAKRCETGHLIFYPRDQTTVGYPDGSMRRTHAIHVHFDKPFSNTPWLSIAISYIDHIHTSNLRLVVGVNDISTTGFNGYAYEWHDTMVVRADANWIACNF